MLFWQGSLHRETHPLQSEWQVILHCILICLKMPCSPIRGSSHSLLLSLPHYAFLQATPLTMTLLLGRQLLLYNQIVGVSMGFGKQLQSKECQRHIASL